MAALTITASNVIPDSGYTQHNGTAGEAITAGELVYLKSADGKYWLAQCDGTAEEATIAGIALNDAAVGQPVRIAKSGVVAFGSIITVGTRYYAGTTPGSIIPHGDLVSTNYVSYLGTGKTATKIAMGVHNTGVQVA